ncbi:hypothetical protein M9H77_02603 [Catharanthus roseus]|uniref:Uncharacterized protein n=1 Tax=Catharanthus roseus TaxID=4058 RepID=A0ACC0C8X9_CATRO|nr:hypothetical protein M9H77_02603 [Catharanthus roseus]
MEISEVSLRVGIHPLPNTGHSRTIRNANDLSPRMQVISDLIDTNLVPRSCKSLNELRIINIYLLDKLLSSFPVNLLCIIIHFMQDMVSTNRKNRIFSYPLLLTDIFRHFEIDFSGKEQVTTTSSDIINSDTFSRSSFEYNEIEKRWIGRLGLCPREAFSFERTRPARCLKKAVAEEDEGEEAEVSDE